MTVLRGFSTNQRGGDVKRWSVAGETEDLWYPRSESAGRLFAGKPTRLGDLSVVNLKRQVVDMGLKAAERVATVIDACEEVAQRAPVVEVNTEFFASFASRRVAR